MSGSDPTGDVHPIFDEDPTGGGTPTLDRVIAGLGSEERLVLLYIAERIAEGQARYGRFDLARDPRDLELERAAELADVLVYSAAAELRRVLTAREAGGAK